MKQKFQIPVFLLVCILSLFTIIFVIPMISGILISFTDWNGLSKEYNLIGIYNYTKMFQDLRFLDSLNITIVYTFILLSCTLVLGYISAKAIQKLQYFKSFALFVSFFPYAITPVVACILWNQLYIGLIPEIGKLLEIEILQMNLLSNKETALLAVAIVDLWILVPYATLLFSSSLNSIPSDIIECAQVEGASPLKIALYIELPFIFSTIGMLTTMITSYAFTHIDTLMTLTSGGPGRATETLYYTIYKNSILEQRYAYGLAEGLVVSVFSIIVFLVVNKIFTNGKYTSDITTDVD